MSTKETVNLKKLKSHFFHSLCWLYNLNTESPQAIFRTGFFVAFHWKAKSKKKENIFAGPSLYYYLFLCFYSSHFLVGVFYIRIKNIKESCG